MQRVRKISNSLIKPIVGDRDHRDRERQKEAERERERQLVADWKSLNQRQGANLQRSTSNPTRPGATLTRSTSNPLSSKATHSAASRGPPPRPVIVHPEPVTEQSRQRLPTQGEMAQLQEARRRAGYGPVPDPHSIRGVRAGPQARLRRSASESRLAQSYVPWLDRKPVPFMDEDELARQRADAREREARYTERLQAEENWRDRRRPMGNEAGMYPDVDERAREKATLMGKLSGLGKRQEERGSVKTKGGAMISPPLWQEPTNANIREDSYSKPRAVPHPPDQPRPSQHSRRPAETPKPITRGLRRSSSEVALDAFLQEQQRLAAEDRRRERADIWNGGHQRTASHDVNKPTVPLKVHKKASSADISMSSPAVLSMPRRSHESDRTADRKRDPSTHSSRRRHNPGPPVASSILYREEYITPPKSHRRDKTKESKEKTIPAAPQDTGVQPKAPVYPQVDIYLPPATSTPSSRHRQLSGGSSKGSLSSMGSPYRQPQPTPLSPPHVQRQLSNESSAGSSKSRTRAGSTATRPPPYQPVPMPVMTPRRQNTAPQPTSTSHALGSSPPSREPARKPSSSSVAQRRDKSLDRIVIFPTDPYGKPLEKELPDTPSLYTPTNFGPPSPTTKPYMPPVPSLPSSLRVGTNASFDTPLSSLRLSPGIQLRQLPGVQHTVEVSKPRASVVAASGFMAEIVSQPEPLPSRSKKHEHRDRDRDRDRSERGRRERREERRVADPAQHVKGPIYGPPASSVDPVRVYVPPTYRSATQSPSKRAIYASPTAIDRTRAEPSTVYGSSRSPQASTSTGHVKSKRSDYGGLYSGYSRP